MTNGDTSVPTAGAEQRIDNAVDAIRNMSQDLTDEVAPRSTWFDQISAATREAPVQSLVVAFVIDVLLARRWCRLASRAGTNSSAARS